MEKENNNDDIFTSLDISGNNFTPKKILCIFQKNSSKEKSFGVSHIELIPSNNVNCIIYSGDYPLYSQASFPFFISSYQPSFILIHSHPESGFLPGASFAPPKVFCRQNTQAVFCLQPLHFDRKTALSLRVKSWFLTALL